MNRLAIRIPALFLAASLAACGGNSTPISPEEVQLRANTITSDVVDRTAGTLDTLAEAEVFAGLEPTLNALTGLFGAQPLDVTDFLTNLDFTTILAELTGALNTLLSERVFNADQVDTIADDAITYRLERDITCEMTDDTCALLIDLLRPIVTARLVGNDGLDLDVAFGPMARQTMTIQMRDGSIVADADLDALAAVIDDVGLSGLFDAVPSTLTGGLQIAIDAQNNDVNLSASITEDVNIDVEIDEGPVAVTLGNTSPLFVLSATGNTIETAFSVGTVNATLPYSTVTSDMASTGDVDLVFGGASFNISVDTTTQAFAITNFGFGDQTATVSRDGTTLISLDLNQNSGRRAAMSIASQGASDVLVTFTPEFHLATTLNLTSVASDFTDLDPKWQDTTLELILTGASGASVMPVAMGGTDVNGVELVSGSLELRATGETTVTVNPGQCLAASDAPSMDMVLTGLAAAACPQ